MQILLSDEQVQNIPGYTLLFEGSILEEVFCLDTYLLDFHFYKYTVVTYIRLKLLRGEKKNLAIVTGQYETYN